MSISAVNKQPAIWGSMENPIVYVVSSNITSATGFKYVFDIYVDGTKRATIKQPPNPQGYGVLDVSKVIRAYLTPSEFPVDFPITTGKRLQTGDVLSKRFYVKVGEEYLVGSSYVTYDGNNNTTPGDPAYQILLSGSLSPSVIASALDPYTYYDATLEGLPAGSAFPSQYTSLQNRQALSMWDATLNQKVYDYDRSSLTLVSLYPGLTGASTQKSYIYGFKFETYGVTGSVLSTTNYFNLTGNGGGPWTSSTVNFSGTPDSKYSIVTLDTSPSSYTLPTGSISYSFTAYLTATGATGQVSGTFGDQASAKYTYELNECDDQAGFTRVRLVWLNSVGGFDYFNFIKANSEEFNKSSQSYYRSPQEYTGTWSYDPYTGGNLVYDSDIQVKRAISTDWLTEQESEFLAGLFKSTRVYAYIADSSSERGRPVSVTDSTYAVKTYAREKLFQYNLTIQESHVYPSQNL